MSVAAPAAISIVPMPANVVALGGVHRFERTVTVRASEGLQSEFAFLSGVFAKGGITLKNSEAGQAEVDLDLEPSRKDLGAEGYNLRVEAGAVRIIAAQSAGIFYGLQSLRQLLPPEIESAARAKDAVWEVPCVEISDHPRFPWRGVMVDDSRHFFPKKDIENILDLMALHKFNTFHWHLNDDGGWRLEIKKYPKLTSWGAWRLPSTGEFPEYKGLSFPGPWAKNPYGGFHTQEDVREIVAYATARHINIVPEIEMPGHNLAATRSYPELICSPSLTEGFRKEYGFESPNIFCAGKESTFVFLENVLDEVMELFPSKTIHIGGDEVDKWLWTRCPDCLSRMKEQGLKTPDQLESYFIQQIEKYLNSKGRKLIGWDEILEGGLAPNATVMSWRGISGGIAAAKAGHNVVMTPWDDCYFDHSNALLTLEQVRRFEPIPPDLSTEEGKHILGAQACVWTETVPTIADLQDRLFPRLASMANVLWGPKSVDEDPAAHLDDYMRRLSELGVHFHVPSPRTPFTVIPVGDEQLTLRAPRIEGSTVRYTTDGSAPTVDSPVYRGPIPTDTPMTVTAGFFLPDGRRSEPTRVVIGNIQPIPVTHRVAGLTWGVYPGPFERVPNFEALTPTAIGVTSTIGLQGSLKEHYALSLTGYLRIEKAGIYELGLSSDDGSTLFLGATKVIDNDGYHGEQTQTARLKLSPGDYPIKVGYFQGTEDQSLKLTIQGGGMKRMPIPASCLWH